MGFHNTIHQDGSELGKSRFKANAQEQLILNFFLSNPVGEFTPFEVKDALNLDGVPITSIRRAISNLTEDEELIKTDTQKEGGYGKPNYCWKLNPFGGKKQNTPSVERGQEQTKNKKGKTLPFQPTLF